MNEIAYRQYGALTGMMLEVSVCVYKIGTRESMRFRGVLDTGAISSSVSPFVVKRLGLQTAQVLPFRFGLHEQSSEIVRVHLKVDEVCIRDMDCFVTDRYSGYDVVIGMDVLSQGDLCIFHRKDGVGRFLFAVPSAED